ncbi:tRNA modification GTPase GTPBP3, mitochondrial-like [Mercenaria mercenaria]|uniref:tRNA modification GTPase GTPBP3, mitochondrial-like n=1 Tax=Mercenaria mercenaria TaxID=6596 RepID=UPI00234FAD03|nr:tRNA modification GTPase GTPBP3, mitochondrial-like [Mercenaria mercenaria]XP_045156677.2 tRNA modification GTPase GTPBP3, mitochondrial-like [Mercenaria mercenaria]
MCARLHVLASYTRTLQILTGNFSRYISSLSLKHISTEELNSNEFLSKFRTVKFKTLGRKSTCFLDTRRHSSDIKGHNSAKTGTTIFSLSSGHGKCGVAVIRLSGPSALQASTLIGQFKHVPAPREANLRKLIDPETGVVIDKGIVIVFPGPHSFTGEDCVEFQVHGGPAVVSAVLTALHKIPGCRQAEPGEFTKRAFMNGKMDLTEVEGLGDLIHAETEAQRRQALRQMEGDLSKLYSKWRTAFIKCAADLEAFIDFSEDQNIDDHVLQQVKDRIHLLQDEIENHLNDKRQGERLRQGVHVVIIGEPNVGKSSLLNAICQRPAAIVTDVAGTTRDVIETHVNIGGYPVLLSDTAGLRETQDVVEKEGVSRAVKRANEADVKIVVVDVSSKDFMNFINVEKTLSHHLTELGLNSSHKKIDMEHSETAFENSECNVGRNIQELTNTIIVFNKVDLAQNNNISKLLKAFDDVERTKTNKRETDYLNLKDLNENSVTNDFDIHIETLHSLSENINSRRYDFDIEKQILTTFKDESTDMYSHTSQLPWKLNNLRMEQMGVGKGERSSALCFISCLTGEGLDNFIDILKDMVADMCGNPLSDHPSLTHARHRSHLTKCLAYLEEYNLMTEQGDIVLASEALRCALKEIGKITGKISSEEILDVIFRDFCIGK